MKPVVEPKPSPENPPEKVRRYEAKPSGSWRKAVGSMKDCDLAPEAFRLGAKWRERLNRRGW